MRKLAAQSFQVPAMADVVEINTLDQLQSYRLAWNSLLGQTHQATFYHTFDWFSDYWRHLGQDGKMRVLVIRAAGKPIGIVPLCVHTEAYQVGNLRVLTYPLADWGTWYGPIGANPSASLFMAMQHVRATPRVWDLLDLRWTNVGSLQSNGNITERAMRVAGYRPRKRPYQQVSVIDLEGGWESYLASKSSKWRHELRRQSRAIEALGQVQFVRHRPASAAEGDGDPRWDLLQECIEISQSSWQGKSTTGTTLSHEQIGDYIRDTHASAARLGMLDLTMLTVDGRPAAFTYNYHFAGRLYGLRIGYDAAVSRRGLCNVLLARTLEDSFGRKDRCFDLGVGDYLFKRGFRTNVETSYQYSHYSWLPLRTQGVRLTRWLKDRLPDRPQKEKTARKHPAVKTPAAALEAG
jgi:CelD/BcsL family acetyltransferase involved in cellulose biosynthesis